MRHGLGPAGENLQSKYGGTDADEVDSGTGKYLVKSVTTGGCASCGGGGGSLTHEYFYLQLDHGTADSNEVVWLVVEDTKDAQWRRRAAQSLWTQRRGRCAAGSDDYRPLRHAGLLVPVAQAGRGYGRQAQLH